VSWIVQQRNRRTGRVTYQSKVSGVGESRTPDKAKTWADRAEAERWAAMIRSTYERSIFDVEVTVQPAPPPRGTRYIPNDVLGIQVAGRPVNLGVNGVFVDCIDCGRRDRLDGDNVERVTDDEARDFFETHGWTVTPTRCPDHARMPR